MRRSVLSPCEDLRPREDEKELAEAVLRTRRWSFRAAFPEILGEVRRMVACHKALSDERRRGADRMIRDYREIIRQQ